MTIDFFKVSEFKMFVSIDSESHQWKGFSFIVPCVCVGNVGQLAVDLLISTMKLKKVGFFYCDSVLPVVGNDPFTASNTAKTCTLMSPLEVFADMEKKLLVLQQRSPCVKGKSNKFIEMLAEWIYEHQIGQIIILTSLFAHERLDKQMMGPQFRYLLSPKMEVEEGEKMRDCYQNDTPLEPRPALIPKAGETALPLDGSDLSQYYFPGGGLAKPLFEKCASDGLPVAILLYFVNEGDNAYDAVALATKLNDWKALQEITVESGWKPPPSWSLLYGNDADKVLYN